MIKCEDTNDLSSLLRKMWEAKLLWWTAKDFTFFSVKVWNFPDAVNLNLHFAKILKCRCKTNDFSFAKEWNVDSQYLIFLLKKKKWKEDVKVFINFLEKYEVIF